MCTKLNFQLNSCHLCCFCVHLHLTLLKNLSKFSKHPKSNRAEISHFLQFLAHDFVERNQQDDIQITNTAYQPAFENEVHVRHASHNALFLKACLTGGGSARQVGYRLRRAFPILKQ